LSFRPKGESFSFLVCEKGVAVHFKNDLERRLYEHKHKLVKGYTEKYNVHKLVCGEDTGDLHSALAREKEIKKWRREKKDALARTVNPEWKDLAEEGNDFSPRSK
jgi:putative endonuclease